MTSTGRPVDACVEPHVSDAPEAPAEVDFYARFSALPPADPKGGEDSETRPAGLVMVIMVVATYGVVRLVRRRRRK